MRHPIPIPRLLTAAVCLAASASVAVATCCTSVTSGPVAYAPEFSNDSCLTGYRKASYGGSVTFATDNTFVTARPATCTAELLVDQTMGYIVVASSGGPAWINCGATTQVSGWPTTMTCLAQSGRTYASRYTGVYTGLCNINSTLTVTVTSTTSTCP
jgi:hypothetical protein